MVCSRLMSCNSVVYMWPFLTHSFKRLPLHLIWHESNMLSIHTYFKKLYENMKWVSFQHNTYPFHRSHRFIYQFGCLIVLFTNLDVASRYSTVCIFLSIHTFFSSVLWHYQQTYFQTSSFLSVVRCCWVLSWQIHYLLWRAYHTTFLSSF